MSTRATYSFEHEETGQTIVFYIHHDGYFEGAADYFWRMYQQLYRIDEIEDYIVTGYCAESFIRVNEEAVFTTSHFDHEDTEYHYSVNKDGILTAEKCYYSDDESASCFDDLRQFKVHFKGHYTDFINQHHQSTPTIYPIAFDMTRFYMTLDAIEKYISILRVCKKENPGNFQKLYLQWKDVYEKLSTKDKS